MRFLLALLLCACACACTDDRSTPDPDPDAGLASDGGTDAGRDAGSVPELPETIGPAERPARLEVPTAHDGVTALPAVFLLHGYGANGEAQDTYFGLSRSARAMGFYTIVPDGTVDSSARRFWDATPACCNFGGIEVDDVAYLTSLIDELEGLVPVSAVYFVGHSNGGFMSYRMACERSDRIDAIVSLAGSDFLNDDDCVPSEPVSVLQIHGTLDDTILYGGSPAAYPGARTVVERWAARSGCELTPADGEPLDLDGSIAGAETTTESYATGCDGASAELWSIVGGGHIPPLTRDFSPAVLAWLSAHAR